MDETGHRVSAEVRTLGDATLRSVSILLSEHIEHDFRPERLDDLLEKAATFVDVWDQGAQKGGLLAKDAVIWLRVRAGLSDLSQGDLFTTRRRIAVRFTDGTTIAGSVLYTLGEPHGPLSTFMNQQGQYFEIVDEGHIYFVHKKFVTWAEELSP
jgi:hypothetical protein